MNILFYHLYNETTGEEKYFSSYKEAAKFRDNKCGEEDKVFINDYYVD